MISTQDLFCTCKSHPVFEIERLLVYHGHILGEIMARKQNTNQNAAQEGCQVRKRNTLQIDSPVILDAHTRDFHHHVPAKKTPLSLSGTRDITTDRLDLRKFKSRDAANLHRWSNDEQNLKYFQGNPSESVEEAECAIASWRAQYANDDYLLWCIQEAATKEAIGKISATIDAGTSCAEMEYTIAYWARGKGYAAEALSAVIDHLHNEVGIHRVQARIHYENVASMRTAERAGMQWEGLLRDGLVDRNGKYYDISIYSHLERDDQG